MVGSVSFPTTQPCSAGRWNAAGERKQESERREEREKKLDIGISNFISIFANSRKFVEIWQKK
ncbi:MAG: hypothetical protein IJ151_03755 [Bacteroidales bacterium]|nr:hypothetical protein [Bacteroidales bacterium]